MKRLNLRMSATLSPPKSAHVKKARQKNQDAAYGKDMKALDALERKRKK